MAKQAKKTRVDIEPAVEPLALSLGALLGREETVNMPEGVSHEEKKPPGSPRELPGRVVLSRETKGRGGKSVTRLSFREGTPSDVPALARSLRTVLGYGGTVEDGDILLQGDQVERAAEWFAARRVRVYGARRD